MINHKPAQFVYAIAMASILWIGLWPVQARAQDPITITIGTTDFPQSLDPATAVDMPSWEILNHLAVGLTRQIPGTLTYELALAESHQQSADGLTHEFTIRADAVFDDGTPITAETFARSINRVIDLGRDGAEFVSRYVASVEASPSNTLTFTLQTPLPDFVALVGLPPFFPQHPASYPADDIIDPAADDLNLITNGAYRLAAYAPGATLTLNANPDYAGDLPANDTIVLRNYRLPIDLREALLNHGVDIAWRALAQPDRAAAEAQPELVTIEQPNLQMFYLLLNHNTITLNNQNSFDDPALREAMAYLIDRETSANLGWDATLSAANTIIPQMFDTEALPFPDYDYENADVILEAAGYRPRRRPVTTALYMSTDTYGDLLGSAANELRRGIEQSEIVDITFISDSLTNTFISAVNRGEYLGAIVGWWPHFASPAAYLFGLAHVSSPIPNGAGYTSAGLDALLEEAGIIADQAGQSALYTEVQSQLLENYDVIPLWQGMDVITYWQDIQGVQVEANSWLRFASLSR